MRQLWIKFLYWGARIYWRLFQPLTVGVKVMLIQDDRVLLVRHTYQPGWFFPGGGVKRKETLETAVRREAREEIGATLGPLHLFGIYTHLDKYKSDHMILFLCRDFQLHGSSDPEIAAAQFFPLDQLPPDTSIGTSRRIQEYQTGHLAPDISTW